VLKRHGEGVARPGWALAIIGAALFVGVVTWVALRRRDGKS